MHSPPTPHPWPLGVTAGEGLAIGEGFGLGVTTVVGVELGVGVGAFSSMQPVNSAITAIAIIATNPTTLFLFMIKFLFTFQSLKAFRLVWFGFFRYWIDV